MTITVRSRFVVMLTCSLALCGPVMAAAAAPLGAAAMAGTLPGPGAGSRSAAPAVQQATGAAAQRAAVRYWTSARMTAALRRQVPPAAERTRVLLRRLEHRLVHQKQAAPASAAPWLSGDTGGRGLRWGHGGVVAAAVGKVFFTLNDVDYVCSGALVGSAHPDVVLTAAHCVTGGRGPSGATEWATNWMFIPGYSDGQSPYGEYTARKFFVTSDWSGPTGGREQYDVAFVQIAPGSRYGDTGAASPPPGLPVSFAASQNAVPARQAYVFGYPSLPPYTGLYPDYCAGPVTASRGSLRTSCGMTAGDSGGPWLAGFSSLPGNGTIVAVSTYKVASSLRVLYGAVLGPQARSLYARAVSPVR